MGCKVGGFPDSLDGDRRRPQDWIMARPVKMDDLVWRLGIYGRHSLRGADKNAGGLPSFRPPYRRSRSALTLAELRYHRQAADRLSVARLVTAVRSMLLDVRQELCG